MMREAYVCQYVSQKYLICLVSNESEKHQHPKIYLVFDPSRIFIISIILSNSLK